MIKAVIFDLDGTLLNTLEDLANASNFALRSCGYNEHPIKDYIRFVGSGRYILMKRILPEEDKNKLVTRINKLIGQMNGIKKMIEDDRYCDDILIQLSAIDKSIKSLANVILDNHMHTCLIENIENGNYEVINEIIDLFKRFQ